MTSRRMTLRRRVGQRKQRAGMPHRQGAGGEVGAHLVRKPEQAHEVRDRTAILPHRGCDLVLREAELVCEPPVRERLVNRIEVLALDVLDEGELQQLLAILDVADDDRDLMQAGTLRRRRRSPAMMR